jgi:predicted DNA-binding antitoxin AbrB/MazE fold protein
MALQAEAVYENGYLKLERALPLSEHQRVRLTIHTEVSAVRRNAGIMGWTGSVEDMEYLALDPELGLEECP